MNVTQVADELLKHNNIMIVTHKNPDGDTLCSSSALCRSLNRCGINAYIFPNPQISDKFMKFVGEYLAPEDFKPDYYCSVDVASDDMFLLGFEGHINLCIDHHPTNPGFGDLNYISHEKAACGEIITEIVEKMPRAVDATTATLLYIAVTTDCGAFMYANTTADTFECCARLLRYGADFMLVNSVFFRKVSKSRIALEAMILSGLEYYEEGKIVVSSITLEMMDKSQATESDTDDLAAIPGRVDTEIIGITVREQDKLHCKISVRTSPGISASSICGQFGGGGHEMAGGCTIGADIKTAKEMILNASIKALNSK